LKLGHVTPATPI